MPSNKQLRVGQDSGGSIEEYPGSCAGPGVVQQHVFKNITTHSLTNGVKAIILILVIVKQNCKYAL